MEYANIMLELGGDTGTTVPKRNVSAAEIAVLTAIHGEAAISEIDPCDGPVDKDGDPVQTSNRAELARLKAMYGHAKDSDDKSIVETLFPGAAARVFETLDELDIDESFYKADRVQPKRKADPLDHDEDGKKGGSKARKGRATKKAVEAAVDDAIDDAADAAQDDEGDSGDGVGDMNDGAADILK